MKKIISKLKCGLVVTLICAAATTALSQEQPKIDRDALAARGAVLTNQDQLALELRDQQSGESARIGFDIGMAIAEGHTAPGPGKDRSCGLSGEPAACTLAVQFSVDRNRHKDLVNRGTAIANADPSIAAARNRTRDVFYRLGFDIGLGASEGHTLPGPGKDAIRESLQQLTARRGFTAAVSLTLERNRRNEDLGATTGTTAGPADKAQKAPSNEIRCRGGRIIYGLGFIAETTKLASTGETLIVTLLEFQPSANAAGARGEGLRPGECAWADRPISGRFLIRFETPANAQLKQKLQGIQVDTSPKAAEMYPDARLIPIYLEDSNHYWKFFGGPPVNNFLTATDHGYWKPAIAVGDAVRSPTEPARRKGSMFPPKP